MNQNFNQTNFNNQNEMNNANNSYNQNISNFNNQQMQTPLENNNIPPVNKKSNIKLIIGIISAIAVIIVGIIIATKIIFKEETTNNNNNNNNNNTTENTNQNENIDNQNASNNTSNKENWDEYELVIDGISLKFPMTYKDFLSKGFYQEKTYHTTTRDVEVASYEMDATTHVGTANSPMGDETFTNGTTNNISLLIYNPENVAKTVNDSYVVGIKLETNTRTFGEITIGEFKIKNNSKNTEVIMNKSTISEISELFGNKHYVNRYENEFTYMPDSNNDNVIDINDLNAYKTLHLYCDTDTQVLNPYDFNFTDFGNLKK